MLYISIAAGLVMLFFGGEAVVRGAVALARRFEVSPLVIGLTIVGFGTSLPELTVSLNAALVGSPGIAVGNVVGSNMANMMLILGIAAFIYPITVNPRALRRDGSFMMVVTILFVVVGLRGSITAGPGALMVLLLLAYVGYSLWHDSRQKEGAAELYREEADELGDLPRALWLMAVFVVGGFALLIAGSEMLVSGAIGIAKEAGVSDEVIGLTLVAIGTSLPELATSIVAAYRRHSDVCVGNVIGSNIFNLLGILGLTSLAVPIPFAPKIVEFDLWVLLGATALLVPFMMTGWRINRFEGTILLVLYGAYVVCQFTGISGIYPGGGA